MQMVTWPVTYVVNMDRRVIRQKHKSNADCNTEIEESDGERGQQAGATTNYN